MYAYGLLSLIIVFWGESFKFNEPHIILLRSFHSILCAISVLKNRKLSYLFLFFNFKIINKVQLQRWIQKRFENRLQVDTLSNYNLLTLKKMKKNMEKFTKWIKLLPQILQKVNLADILFANYYGSPTNKSLYNW